MIVALSIGECSDRNQSKVWVMGVEVLNDSVDPTAVISHSIFISHDCLECSFWGHVGRVMFS